MRSVQAHPLETRQFNGAHRSLQNTHVIYESTLLAVMVVEGGKYTGLNLNITVSDGVTCELCKKMLFS